MVNDSGGDPSFLFSLKMKRQNIRTLSLVVCTFTYLLVGAAVFDRLESENESIRWEVLKTAKDNFHRKYQMTEEDYRMLEITVLENRPHKVFHNFIKFAPRHSFKSFH